MLKATEVNQNEAKKQQQQLTKWNEAKQEHKNGTTTNTTSLPGEFAKV